MTCLCGQPNRTCSMETIVSNESTAIRVLFFLWTGAPIQPHVGFWGGGLKNDLESNKKSWIGEAVKLRNTLACRVLGERY